MPITSQIKGWLNAILSLINLRIETLTADRIEAARLAALVAKGHFSKPAFPILRQFADCEPDSIIEGIVRYKAHLQRYAESNRAGYSFGNEYFSSPDAEVAYVITRVLKPKRILEIGAGNSTRLFREAIKDAHATTELISVDPSPRTTVHTVADQVIQRPVQEIGQTCFQKLQNDDILFIDSSHNISAGSDVVYLVLEIIPGLAPGVLVHFHDIFLPYEYPKEWIVDHRYTWNEQYLIQAWLQESDGFEVLWPGHFLQKTWGGFAQLFEPRPPGTASSLWLRKTA
jgi:hypothetical protein